MPFKLNPSSQLHLLIFVMCVFIIGTGLYATFQMKAMNQSTRTLFADRVYPLQELTTIRISYATGILASAEQAKTSQFTFAETNATVRQAENKIVANWKAYTASFLTPEEVILSKQAAVFISNSLTSVHKLEDLLDKGDANAVKDIINQELYPSINPTIAKLNELIDLQVRVSAEVYKNSTEVYGYAIKRFFLLMAVFLVFAVPFSSFLIINIKTLINDLKNSNQKITESEANYRQLFNVSPAPMWVYNEKTCQFIQVNQACIDNYGYSQEEFLSMTINDILPQYEGNEIRSEDIKENRANARFTDGQKHKTKSGELIDVETSSIPVVLNGKKQMMVISIDITEQTLYEQKLTRAAIKAQEDERYEIGGELHDNVCQILSASQLFLGMMKKGLPEDMNAYFENTRQSILLALQEVRNLSHRLAPAFFDDATMEDAFKNLLKGFNVENRYEINLDFDKAAKSFLLSRELELNLYRILQEQLRNILKHANATSIQVAVVSSGNMLQMRIADNGIGFDVNNKKPGIGLANMNRRVQLFSGKLLVYSAPGNGCMVMVEVPVKS